MARPRLEHPEYRLVERHNGIYAVSWTEHGKTQRVTTGSRDPVAAEAWRQRFVAEQHRPVAPQEQATVAMILDGYLDDRKAVVAAHDTLAHACKPLRRELGALYPDQLTIPESRRYIRARRKQGRADGTILREVVTLRAALSWAVKARWIAAAPYVEAPPAPRPRNRWLTVQEVAAILRACPSRHLRLFVLLALYTAARTSAILELTWDRVDLERGRIELALPGRDHGNKRRAMVPVNRRLGHFLRRHREWALTDHVIEYGGEPIARVRRAFARAAIRAGVENVTPHDLRRTAASWMVQEGVAIEEVARYLGDSEEMVRRVYGHHSPEYLRRASEALGRRRA